MRWRQGGVSLQPKRQNASLQLSLNVVFVKWSTIYSWYSVSCSSNTNNLREKCFSVQHLLGCQSRFGAVDCRLPRASKLFGGEKFIKFRLLKKKVRNFFRINRECRVPKRPFDIVEMISTQESRQWHEPQINHVCDACTIDTPNPGNYTHDSAYARLVC